MTGIDHFNFTIEKAGSTEQVPAKDHTGSTEGHFAYVFAGDQTPEAAQTEIEMNMIHGANHLIECFNFWIAMKVSDID